ncbi:MAG: Inositol monophosphatase [Parcubacteria group bacterium GW2011_GWA2_36_24]|nr:MAG: Inositol monophosphatase [Parcubacteria group bacterium GW2011_GWA2_36_24]
MPSINRLLLEKFTRPKKVSYKSGGIDHLGTSVMTETDREVETILKNKLLKILPGSGFIGEETKLDVKEFNWIVDPIDGTLNYANQVPVFAYSIALWHQNQPIYALVSLPLTQETLHAISGQGIWLNGKPVKPAKKTTKHGAQIALGRIDGGVFMNQALWDIAAIVLLAQEAHLAVKYLSKQPNISADTLKDYQYSLVIGPEKLANELADKLK